MSVAAFVLAVLLVVALIGWGVTARLLRETREELEQARAAVTVQEQARTSAEWVGRSAAKAVFQTVGRLREGGLTHLVNSSLEDLAHWVSEDRGEIVRMTAPDGTTTLFFSDIENSTALNEQLGDRRWLALLKSHDLVVRSAIEGNHGHVVKTQGDGFFAVFLAPGDAVRASKAIQHDLHARRRLKDIRVRIGLHTGQVLSRDGDYFGRNVAMAARVAGPAGGGQTLVSSEVRDALHEEVLFEPIGEYELKGLTGTHELWAVR
jgi:class 3 adenylate cyclase